MSDLLLQFGASNLCISLILALLAYVTQVTFRRPVLAHLLWLLVLVKLVTPPLFTVPMLPLGSAVPAISTAVPASDVTASALPAATAAATLDAKTALIGLWLLGSAVVLIGSLWRVYRFNRLVTMASHEAPPHLQRRADGIARRLRLAIAPTIYLTSAKVSPMVWWVGGRVRIFMPAALPREIKATELHWVLAHELAHVRRRDHLVRWLEWLACVAFWWNPVAWWARRNLRANEEVCCDALVLQTFHPKPHIYANSLLSVVEFLASPALRPPAMASEINSGGFLERRFRMIVSKTPIASTPRWLQTAILLCTIVLMPLGVAYAQDPDVGAVGRRLRQAVEAGELTGEQAKKMLGVLQQGQNQKKAVRTTDRETAAIRKYLEAIKDELGAAVESGRITEEAAKDRLDGAQKRARARLDSARRDGTVGAEQRRRRAEKEIRWDISEQRRADARNRIGAIKNDLTEAVEVGGITEKQAKARLEEAMKRIQVRLDVEAQDRADRMADQARANRDAARRRTLERVDRNAAQQQADIEKTAENLREAMRRRKMEIQDLSERLDATKRQAGVRLDVERARRLDMTRAAADALRAENAKLRAELESHRRQNKQFIERTVDLEAVKRELENSLKARNLEKEAAHIKWDIELNRRDVKESKKDAGMLRKEVSLRKKDVDKLRKEELRVIKKLDLERRELDKRKAEANKRRGRRVIR